MLRKSHTLAKKLQGDSPVFATPARKGPNPDGSLVAAGPHGAVAHLFDSRGKRPGRAILPGRRPDARSRLAFSPDGASLLVVDPEIVVVDVATGEVRLELFPDENEVRGDAAAWSPDGRTIATVTGGGPIRLWDAETGRALATLNGHESRVTSLAFSPDGTTLASGGADTTVLVWEVPKK